MPNFLLSRSPGGCILARSEHRHNTTVYSTSARKVSISPKFHHYPESLFRKERRSGVPKSADNTDRSHGEKPGAKAKGNEEQCGSSKIGRSHGLKGAKQFKENRPTRDPDETQGRKPWATKYDSRYLPITKPSAHQSGPRRPQALTFFGRENRGSNG